MQSRASINLSQESLPLECGYIADWPEEEEAVGHSVDRTWPECMAPYLAGVVNGQPDPEISRSHDELRGILIKL